MSVRVWFEARTIKEGIKIAMKIWKFKEFDDCGVMIESPKKSICIFAPPDKRKMDVKDMKKAVKKLERGGGKK